MEFFTQDPRDCKTFLLKTGFCSVRVPFVTGFTISSFELLLFTYKIKQCRTPNTTI